MNEICQLAHGISEVRYFAFSLTGLIAFMGLAGAYFYFGPIKGLIYKLRALINGFIAAFGAGLIGFLLFANKFLC